jgi:hypothetical protein
LRRHHAGNGDDGADGKIDFAEQDHIGHAIGGNGNHRHLLHDVHEVVEGEKARVQHREDHAEHGQRNDDAAILAYQRGGEKRTADFGVHGFLLNVCVAH